MATVWEEPGRYRGMAPCIPEVEFELQVGAFGPQYITAKRAARSLLSVAQDINNVIQWYWAPPAPPVVPPPALQWPAVIHGWRDPMELLLLLRYLAMVPLQAVWNIRQQMLNNALPNACDTLFDNRRQQIINLTYIGEAACRQTTVAALTAAPNFIAFHNHWTNAMVSIHNIPQLGTVELLCRSAAINCLNLNTIRTRLLGGVGHPHPGLSIQDIPAGVGGHAGIRARKGIPGAIFICTGHNNAAGQGNTTVVITTSADCWIAFREMSTWVSDNRLTNERLRWRDNLPGPPARDNDLVCPRSVMIRTNFLAQMAAVVPPPTPAKHIAARSNTIAAVAGLALNHLLETATPLHCPQLTPKARCLRCQALFHYNVPAGNLPLETALRSHANSPYRLRWLCAETIAHYCCRNAGH